MRFQPLKPWLDYPDQLTILKQRGLTVANEPRALHYLQSLGYYRLSGYFYPFRQFDTSTKPVSRKDDFIAGSQFDDVLKLYMFDKQLRILAFDALERIEMAIRVDIGYVLGRRNVNAQEQEACLDAKFCSRFDLKRGMKESEYHQWLRKYDSLVQRAKKQDFIKHNLDKYGRLPVWVACEILDFGALSKLYSGMRYKDREKIANKYRLTPENLSQWLRSLNFIRNVVAHHGRLWNANIVERTDFAKSFPNNPLAQQLENNKAFGYFYIMAQLLKTISPTSTWQTRLKQHIEQNFPQPNNHAIKIEDFGYLASFQQMNW
jgi:abortive infection bacteriophage resistance protein